MPSETEPVIYNDHHADKIKRVNRKDEQSEKKIQWLVTLGFLGWAIAMTVLYVQETKVNGNSARTTTGYNNNNNNNNDNSKSSSNNDLADPVIVRAALKGMFYLFA
jgi:hypothetical protein